MFKYGADQDLDKMLYGQYIRYEYLDTLVELEFKGSNSDNVNIFIDLYEALLPLYSQTNTKYATEVIASCILNMVTHYRRYFWNRHRVTTQIIFIHSNLSSTNTTKYCYRYNSKYRNRVLSNTDIDDKVYNAIDILNIMVPYMPDVYFKTGSVEPAVIIKDLILSVPIFQVSPNIVISASEYTYCLPGSTPDTVVFRRKFDNKSKTNIAYSYNFMNACNAFIYETRKVIIEEAIDPRLITLIMVLSGIPKKNITSKKDINSTLKLISDIPVEIIGNIEAMYRYIGEECVKKKQVLLDYAEFYNRYMCIDIDIQLAMYRTLPESKEMQFLTQLSDPDGMKYINGRYFTHYPINFEGV